LTRAFDLDPDNVAVHYGYARVYQRLGYTDEAIAAYKELIRISNSEATAHTELIGLYYINDFLEECIEEARTLRERVPDVIPVRFYLALALFKVKRFPHAQASMLSRFTGCPMGIWSAESGI